MIIQGTMQKHAPNGMAKEMQYETFFMMQHKQTPCNF